APVVEPPKPPPPKITLTGITTFGGKRALMKLNTPPKPGDQAKELFLTLKEGQREGEVEVLAIDEKAGTVKVDDYGTIMDITFEKETAKPGPGPAPTGVPTPAVVPPAPRVFPPGGMSGFKPNFSGRTLGLTPPGQPTPGAGSATGPTA